MIVDNDGEELALLRNVLQPIGYFCCLVRTAEEAERFFLPSVEFIPDLVIISTARALAPRPSGNQQVHRCSLTATRRTFYKVSKADEPPP